MEQLQLNWNVLSFHHQLLVLLNDWNANCRLNKWNIQLQMSQTITGEKLQLPLFATHLNCTLQYTYYVLQVGI